MRTWEDGVDAALAHIRATLIDRHHKYGPDNILRHREHGIIIRVDDKTARLQHALMTKVGDAFVRDDTVEDAWTDVAGFGVIGLMLLAGHFELPLSDEEPEMPPPQPAPWDGDDTVSLCDDVGAHGAHYWETFGRSHRATALCPGRNR